MGFSERFKELREKKGLSQEELAKRLDIPRASVANYEVEDRLPRQKRLNEIADFFGVSVDYLLGRSQTTELTTAEEKFIKALNEKPSLEEIKKIIPNITVDGKPATDEEILAAAAFIRSLRDLKK